MIIGDNHFIQNKILASAAILESIPALRTFNQQIRNLQANCATCSGATTAREQLKDKFNELREFLVKLPADKKSVVRQLAGGGVRIRVSYLAGRGANTNVVPGDI